MLPEPPVSSQVPRSRARWLLSAVWYLVASGPRDELYNWMGWRRRHADDLFTPFVFIKEVVLVMPIAIFGFVVWFVQVI